MTREFQRLPGFRDFSPEDLAVRAHVFNAWRRVSRRYGFMEYDGPPLEPLELYVEKSGQEIVGQLYAFTDRGGREVSLKYSNYRDAHISMKGDPSTLNEYPRSFPLHLSL